MSLHPEDDWGLSEGNMSDEYGSNEFDEYGEIEEAFHDGGRAKFQWRVPNFSYHKDVFLESPTVKYFNVTWRLGINIFPRYNYVLLERNRLASGNLRSVRCSIGYKKADGSEEDIERGSMMSQNVKCLGWSIQPSRYVTPAHELILTFTLCKGGTTYKEGVSRATQTDDASSTNCQIHEDHSKDNSILLEHLRDLRLSGDDHDFLIKVRDKQFRVHKCVLRARSPVFAAMFRSQMTECADHSVTVDDLDPDAFGEFLSYVYTGKVDISSASRALGLYYAGEKYDIPRLKEMSLPVLKSSLTTTRISDVISLAVRHDEGELLQQALVYLATNLKEVLETVEWQRFLVANPIQANEMCIKALTCVKKA